MDTPAEALAVQRARTEKMLDFFSRLFLVLALSGAVLAIAFGFSVGTGRGPAAGSGQVAPSGHAKDKVNGSAPAGAKSDATPGERQETAGSDAKDAATGAATGATTGVAAGTSDGTETRHPWTAAAITLAICGAAALTGAAAGFLFGLPRTLTSAEVRAAVQPGAANAGSDPGALGGTSSTLGTNTNLEQISDWLTKIIVGVGLTKLDSLPGYIERFGERTAPFFGFGGKVFGIAGGLYFLVVGFFAGYVLTRTKMTWIFVGSAKEADRISDDYAALKVAATKAADQAIDVKTTPLAPAPDPAAAPRSTGADGARDLASIVPPKSAGPAAVTPGDVVKADRAVLAAPLVDFNSNEELAGRAAAEARAGRLPMAAALYEQVARNDPASRHLVDYAGVLGMLGDRPAATDILATLKTVAPAQQDEARGKMLFGLLRSGLYNGKFEDAIAAGEELLRRPGEADDAWAHLWLACAFGQRHAFLSKQSGTSEEVLRATVDRIVELIQQVATLDPSLKSVIASLYDPQKISGGDDDLQSLWPNDRIDRIL